MPRSRSTLRLFALCAVMGVSACLGDSPTGPRIETTPFAPGLGVDLDASTRTASGLYYRDITIGTGTLASVGSDVVVGYSGALPNGFVFDPGDDPIDFIIGAGGLVAGFEEGTVGMRVGGKRQLIIPPHLGFGSQPRQGIPPNSILVFTIELLSVG
jgi:FKBP-type peptidyl-prolyl cis-trans isomerase